MTTAVINLSPSRFVSISTLATAFLLSQDGSVSSGILSISFLLTPFNSNRLASLLDGVSAEYRASLEIVVLSPHFSANAIRAPSRF